jgi:ABC-type dipeptide/oligopeptide/nickel transport system permease component
VVQGAVLFITVTYVVINLLVDMTYAFIDPRVKYE